MAGQRTCSDCPTLISDRSTGRCGPCARAELRTRPSYANRKMRHAKCFSAEKIARIRRLVEQHGVVQAASIAGVSVNGITRLQRRGWTVRNHGRQQRRRPGDFAIQAGSMTLTELAAHYGAALDTVMRWADEVGREKLPGYRKPRFPLPENARDLAKRHGIAKAAELIGCHRGTLRRRLKELAAREQLATGIGWAERLGQQMQGAA